MKKWLDIFLLVCVMLVIVAACLLVFYLICKLITAFLPFKIPYPPLF